jgi:hypothetical protein
VKVATDFRVPCSHHAIRAALDVSRGFDHLLWYGRYDTLPASLTIANDLDLPGFSGTGVGAYPDAEHLMGG